MVNTKKLIKQFDGDLFAVASLRSKTNKAFLPSRSRLTHCVMSLWNIHLLVIGAGLLSLPALNAIGAEAPPAQVPNEKSEEDTRNQNAVDEWNAKSGSDAKANLIRDEAGKTKVMFTGGTALDIYKNRTVSASGKVGSGVPSGTLHQLGADLEARASVEDGATSYVQSALRASDDRSALPRYRWQMTNFQVGRSTQKYDLQLGDIAVNYSSLGSSVGFRGVRGQVSGETIAAQAFFGIVAESWDALVNRTAIDGQPARQSALREVKGTKFEWNISQSWKAFSTLQSLRELESTLAQPSSASGSNDSSSFSLGAAWQTANWSIQSEFGRSKAESIHGDTKAENAKIIDGSWHDETLNTKFGYHQMGIHYKSLGGTAQPGVTEGYCSVDWKTNSWFSIGADARRSLFTPIVTTVQPIATPQTTDPGMPAPLPIAPVSIGTDARTITNTSAVRASFDVQSWLSGATISIGANRTKTEGPESSTSRNHASNVQFGLQREIWGLTGGHTLGRSLNASNPSADSDTNQLQLTGQWRPWSNLQESKSNWSGSTGINWADQNQRLLLTDQSTRSRQLGLNLSLQHLRGDSLSLTWQTGLMSQIAGGAKLRQISSQFEWNTPIKVVSEKAQLKVFARQNKRNAGDPTLGVSEYTLGTSMSARF